MPERAKQESPRDFKHLAIHVLVEQGFIVFENIAAKEAVDVIVALPEPEEKKLNTAGVRIKTGAFRGKSPEGGWYFSEKTAEFSAENSPFIYIFCCEKREQPKNSLFPECWFIIVSPRELMQKTSTYINGNYSFNISEKQLYDPETDFFWKQHVNKFTEITKVLRY